MKEKLIGIISKQLGIEPETITDDTCLVRDLNADSIDLTELVMTVEKVFGIAIEEDEYQTNVKSLVDLVKSKVK